MVPGYDSPRPHKRDYVNFKRNLISEFSGLGQKGVSVSIYGSYVRGDCKYGRSDIDGMIIFPDEFIINKDCLTEASIHLKNALSDTNINFQVNVADLATMKDGRFNSYDENFKEYFEEEARLLAGPYYLEQFTYELPIMSDQTAVRFNLRKTRTGLLFAQHDIRYDYARFVQRFAKSLDGISRASKQILFLRTTILGKIDSQQSRQ